MDPELVVKFKGDTSDLEKGLAKAKALLNQMPSATDGAAKSTRKYKDSNDELGTSFKSLATGYLSMAAVMQAGRVFLDSTKEVQKFENQLKVASGTQQDYAKNTQFLEGLAARYNKNVIDLGSNFAQLTIATRGTNLEGAKTERLFAAVTATSAALQMSVDDTNGTFRAFIQMVSKGNVQAEELRGQLGERLYGAFNLAAKSMGVTTSALNKMLENGEVLASDLLPRLTIELENSFGAQAQENANNLGSSIDYARGQLTLFLAEFAKGSGFTDWVTEQTKGIGTLASRLRLLYKEKGGMAAVGGALGYVLEDGLKANNYKSPALQYARTREYGAAFGANPAALPNEIKSPPSKFKLPSEIGDLSQSPEAIEKARKAAELAARKAAAAVNKWVSEQIKASQDRIAQGLLENAQKYGEDNKFHGTLGAMGSVQNRGITTGLDNNLEKTQQFTNESSGGGSAMNFDAAIANMSNAVDQYAIQQQRLKNTTDEFGTQLEEGIKSSLAGAIEATAEGVGTLAAGLATGTADMADVGNSFAMIIAGLLENIGKALASWAATMAVAKIAIGSGNIAGALVGAALAFGAAAVARASIKDSSSGAFWTGGINPGKGGVDAMPIMATRGEMILNHSQQGRLFGLLDGTRSGLDTASGGNRSNNTEFVGTLSTKLRSGDIGISARIGEKKNNYFRGRSN